MMVSFCKYPAGLKNSSNAPATTDILSSCKMMALSMLPSVSFTWMTFPCLSLVLYVVGIQLVMKARNRPRINSFFINVLENGLNKKGLQEPLKSLSEIHVALISATVHCFLHGWIDSNEFLIVYEFLFAC